MYKRFCIGKGTYRERLTPFVQDLVAHDLPVFFVQERKRLVRERILGDLSAFREFLFELGQAFLASKRASHS